MESLLWATAAYAGIGTVIAGWARKRNTVVGDLVTFVIVTGLWPLVLWVALRERMFG